MKDDSKKEDIWLEFRKIFDCISTDEDEMHSSLMKIIPSVENFLHLAPCIIFIIDYSTMQFLYFNEKLYDYAGSMADDYLKGGVEFSLNNNHPDDIKIIVDHLFPHIKDFLSKVPPESFKDYKFSFNFRYRRKDGSYQHFIQHSTYLPDKSGNLRYNFAMGSNLPNEDKIKIILTIEKKEKGNYKQVSIETLNVAPQSVFTKRELEILKLLYEGMKSTVIADKLCLSEHTIKNHRKKMLQKTGTANTPALISYAKENGLL